MRVTVDQESCVGAGQCVLNAPDVFDQDDDGFVVLLNEAPGAEDRDAVAAGGAPRPPPPRGRPRATCAPPARSPSARTDPAVREPTTTGPAGATGPGPTPGPTPGPRSWRARTTGRRSTAGQNH
ncbi:ferredoxin [Streptomyces sp. NPDC059134]|uniref:ferredoxin n=1 Tax=Streptomyces sp. NPDC059134 TaxID=3346738 RepID=UPI0036A8728C